MTKHQKLATLLLDLQQELINAQLWQTSAIDQSLLQSTQAFCHDTLSCEQWLQFVFIARLEMLIQQNAALPTKCEITPYFTEGLKNHKNVKNITDLTNQIDQLLSN